MVVVLIHNFSCTGTVILVPVHNAPEPGPGLGSGAFSRLGPYGVKSQGKKSLHLGRGLPPFYWLREKWQRTMHV
jgi:hypothetical protein